MRPFSTSPRRQRAWWSIRRRPNSLPFGWRNITGPTGLVDYVQMRDWRLVLSARHIPHIQAAFRGREYIYVPPILERLALAELTDFTAEGAHPLPPTPKVYAHSGLAVFFLLPLIFWHGLRTGWWPAPDWLPAPATWLSTGALDFVRLRLYGQAYRLVTALTLHAGLVHLWSNVACGALFLPLLARMVGVGRAAWLTLLGGALGNTLALFLRQAPVISLGFSTALFAAVGVLAGFMAYRQTERRKALLPVAAGAALLAMLGTEGENTDYLAHVSGLLCGLGLGLLEAWRPTWRAARHLPELPQAWAGLLALMVPLLAWYWAFTLAR